MADAAVRMVGPLLLADAAATVYTAPGAVQSSNMLHMRFLNQDSSPHDVTVSIGADALATRIFHGSIPAGELVVWNGFEVLAANEFIQAYCDTADFVTFTVSGVETT